MSELSREELIEELKDWRKDLRFMENDMVWGERSEQAYEQIKSILQQKPVDGIPDVVTRRGFQIEAKKLFERSGDFKELYDAQVYLSSLMSKLGLHIQKPTESRIDEALPEKELEELVKDTAWEILCIIETLPDMVSMREAKKTIKQALKKYDKLKERGG